MSTVHNENSETSYNCPFTKLLHDTINLGSLASVNEDSLSRKRRTTYKLEDVKIFQRVLNRSPPLSSRPSKTLRPPIDSVRDGNR